MISLSKLNKHLNTQPVYDFYKGTCLLDSRHTLFIRHDTDSFEGIKNIHEFQIYVNHQDDLVNSFNIPTIENTNKSRFSLVEWIVDRILLLPVSSVHGEHSFSQYKLLLNDQSNSREHHAVYNVTLQ